MNLRVCVVRPTSGDPELDEDLLEMANIDAASSWDNLKVSELKVIQISYACYKTKAIYNTKSTDNMCVVRDGFKQIEVNLQRRPTSVWIRTPFVAALSVLASIYRPGSKAV